VLEARLKREGQRHAKVTVKGDRIVVDFHGDAAEVGRVDGVLRQRGHLAFVLVDHDESVLHDLLKDPPAGVKVEYDVWQSEAGSAHHGLIARAEDRKQLETWIATVPTPDPDHAFAFQREEDPTDRKRPPDWAAILLDHKHMLDRPQILEAAVQQDEWHRFLIQLRFGDAAGKEFEQLTKDFTGRKFAIVFDGEIESAPIIQGVIPGGRAVITMGGTTDDRAAQTRQRHAAEDLANVLLSGELPADLQPVQ
jgi:preprotein translocase subunit SecD